MTSNETAVTFLMISINDYVINKQGNGCISFTRTRCLFQVSYFSTLVELSWA